MRAIRKPFLGMVAAVFVLVGPYAPARAAPVDLMLSLMIDESVSVSGSEFGL